MTVYPHAGKEKVYIEYEFAYFVLHISPGDKEKQQSLVKIQILLFTAFTNGKFFNDVNFWPGVYINIFKFKQNISLLAFSS